jgi:hypothetical protein
MATSVRYEDRLEGPSNYLQWKVRITAVLRENKLWSYVLATEVTPGLLAGADPDAHQFYITIVYRWDDRMEANSKQYHSNSKTSPDMHRWVRSYINFRQ